MATGILVWRLRATAALAAAATTAVHPLAAHARVVVPMDIKGPGDVSDHVVSSPLGPSGGLVDLTARTLSFTSYSAGAFATYLPPQTAPTAQRRAESLAQEGLVRLAQALVLGPTAACATRGDAPPHAECALTLGQAMAADAALSPLLAACARSMQVTRAVYGADGGVTLDVALPLDLDAPGLGMVWAALVPGQPARWPKVAVAATAAAAPRDTAPEPTAGRAVPAATGIVINARGTGFVPSVWPRVTDPQGNVLYGPQVVPMDVLVLAGLMGTTKSLDAALSDARVAPLATVLGAQRSRPSDPHTLVLGEDDARAFAHNVHLVREAKLIVVVD